MSLLSTIKNVVLVPIHPKGQPFIALSLLLTVLLFALADDVGYVGVLLTAFCIYFFRNPVRIVPRGEGFVLASGDGVVSHITQSALPKELGDDGATYHKISIFLNVFNVHVNRVPASGRIIGHHYIAGKFLNAALDKASDDNERTVSLLETAQGHRVGFAQIAGFVARRIHCDITTGDSVTQGARYGIIRFGSRCDIYIPLHYALLINVGTTTLGGETILATDASLYNPATLRWEKD